MRARAEVKRQRRCVRNILDAHAMGLLVMKPNEAMLSYDVTDFFGKSTSMTLRDLMVAGLKGRV